jgi:outer membrane immunogenic protein
MSYKLLLLSSTAVIGLAGFANAADMALKAPPAPIYISSWSGCYIGGHAGYGREQSSSQYTFVQPGLRGLYSDNDTPTPVTSGWNNNGFVGGAQGGCQIQSGTFVWGVEGDWSSFSNSQSNGFNSHSKHSWDRGTYDEYSYGTAYRDSVTNLSVQKDSLWSVRAKFGIITSSDFMLYGTAGVGGERASFNYASTFTKHGFVYNNDDCDPCTWNRPVSIAGSVGANPTGIVAGVGADYKVWGNWLLGVQYLHYAVGSTTTLPFNSSHDGYRIGPGAGDHITFGDVDVVRVQLSYLFNMWR